MLKLFAAVPALAATRALADGSSGTLGRNVVGANELRPGAVSLDKISNLSGARVLGRGLRQPGAPAERRGRYSPAQDLCDAQRVGTV